MLGVHRIVMIDRSIQFCISTNAFWAMERPMEAFSDQTHKTKCPKKMLDVLIAKTF